MRMVVAARAQAIKRNAIFGSNLTIACPPELEFVLLPMDGFSKELRKLISRTRKEHRALVLAISEVDTVWDAREWQRTPRADRYLLKQSRHLGLDLYWDCQFTDQVEKGLRNITEQVTLMRAYPDPTLERFEAGKRPWLFREQRYRPGAVRDLMSTKIDPDVRLGASWVRYRREWEALYDTLAILMPGELELPPFPS